MVLASAEQPKPSARAPTRARGAGVCPWRVWWFAIFYILAISIVPSWASAQSEGELQINSAPDLRAYENRPIDSVEIRTVGPLWHEDLKIRAIKPGDVLSGELVRRGLRELDRSGGYADLRAEVQERDGKTILLIFVRPRRLVETIRWEGGALDSAEQERALALRSGDAVTYTQLEQAKSRLERLYNESGYPKAVVRVGAEETDDPQRVFLRVRIEAHEAETLQRLEFRVSPSPHHPGLVRPVQSYRLTLGARLDATRIQEADEALEGVLVQEGFYEAAVSHEIHPGGHLLVQIHSGPRFSVRWEGNSAFGTSELSEVLHLAEERDPRPDLLERLVREFYVAQGYFDIRVQAQRLDDDLGLATELVLRIWEGERFRIERRIYPCLSGGRSADELDEEIEGVLSEQFPQVGLVAPANATAIDASTATLSSTPRPQPYRGEPWNNFSVESYSAVIEHLKDLYRSEGYLDAKVGPATVVRRKCRVDSPPGECWTDEPLPMPVVDCSRPDVETEKKVVSTCNVDQAKGERCESGGTLVLPIHAGRQAILYDLSVEGNAAFSQARILEVAGLKVGKPLRRLELEGALRRIQEMYEEAAYAFAQIDSDIELSTDHTRARLVLGITERQKVHVQRIDIRGALLTREGLVRSRLSLKVDGKYRRSLVQRSQEQLESLSAFTSVTIGLQDPGVPAKEKVVVITVTERLPQYLDIKGGFGSVDGFRIGFEYGHRNLGGEAIQLTLRSQLALRPPFLIAEADVREKYRALSNLERLERRNTVTLAFPEIGLGPLFRFEVEFLDLGENQRDFIHTRDAGVIRLLFRPRRPYLLQVGGTVELNDATILGDRGLEDIAPDVRVPEGRSVAYTQNFSASWDGRDKPLSATRGHFLSGAVEHVTAVPLAESQGQCNEDSTEVFDPVCSELLRIFGRVAGYLPMGHTKMTLALSFRAGVIQHLNDLSRTYPDRLFFMGGVDTLRGYPQDSLVPQDLADQVLDPENELSINEVILRGGDLFINPRVELRIPLSGSVQTALFVDAGNLWYDRSNFNPFILRYTAGTGLRIETPVGPLVFDYGFNLERLVDAFGGGGENQRDWEEIGAFHFNIGLF